MRFAVVDGYSTGRYLVQELTERGASCVHVASRPDMPPLFTRHFDSSVYETDLGYVGEVRELAHRLRALGLDGVVAGTESGVLLSDELNHLLRLPGHAWHTRTARRDKAIMADVVAAAGLRVPRGAAFACMETALAWYEAAPFSDVVIKPLLSAGSDNVYFCADSAQVAVAVARVVQANNLYGDTNGTALVQERVRGKEFYVNSVSRDGQHMMVETWEYKRKSSHGSDVLYDYEEPSDPRLAETAALHGFVAEVLDALGIENGAAHTEVMFTASGPVLIETGARLGGGTIPSIVEQYGGTSQTRVLACALTGALPKPPAPSVHAVYDDAVRWVSLNNEQDGVICSMAWVDSLRSLRSAVAVLPAVEYGQHVPVTRDLASALGSVYLVHAEPDVVQHDYDRIRAWEREPGFYTAAAC